MENRNWSSFSSYFRRVWEQGQHVSVIGPTGSGKSYLALRIIELRQYYVLFLIKKNDPTLESFIERNKLEVIKRWPGSGFENKIALWPRFSGIGSFDTQSRVFREAINGYTSGGKKIEGIFEEGRWTVLIDEVMYFKEELHLDQEMRMLWTQGRSNDISLVAGTQRPFDVPQLMLNQWSHLFIFQTSDKNEIDRIARVGGNIGNIIRQYVPILGRHEFLYVNRITQQAIRSKA